jgi:hypothetical protein
MDVGSFFFNADERKNTLTTAVMLPLLPLLQHLTLNSQDGQPTNDPGFLRFDIDSSLCNVSSVEWLTMEVHPTSPTDADAVVVTPTNRHLHFSEDLDHFCATLPCGEYTEVHLLAAVEAAMACATPVVAGVAGAAPQNTYRVRRHGTRVGVSTRGSRPFALHVFHERLPIRSLRPLNSVDAHVTFWWREPEPVAKGAIVEIARPGGHPFRAHVLYTVGTAMMIRAFHPCLPDRDVPEDSQWTLCPIGGDSGLPRLLGLGPKDLASWTPLSVAYASPVTGPNRMLVAVEQPHGLVEGDRLLLSGFEGSALNGKLAAVERKVSEYHVEIAVDAIASGLLCPGQTVRFLVSSKGLEVCAAAKKVVLVAAGGSTFVFKVTLDTPSPSDSDWSSLHQDQWYPVQMLPPVPSPDWAHCVVHCRREMGVRCGSGLANTNATDRDVHDHHVSDNPRCVLFSLHFRNKAGPEASVACNAVVAPCRTGLFHERHVLLMRLRLGMQEATGIVSLRPNNKHVFGRAQVRRDGFLSSTDHAVVGQCGFHPPLERVPFVEVAFLTHDGQVLPPGVVGPYSLLLRCRTTAASALSSSSSYT